MLDRILQQSFIVQELLVEKDALRCEHQGANTALFYFEIAHADQKNPNTFFLYVRHIFHNY